MEDEVGSVLMVAGGGVCYAFRSVVRLLSLVFYAPLSLRCFLAEGGTNFTIPLRLVSPTNKMVESKSINLCMNTLDKILYVMPFPAKNPAI